jgi:sigma-B regulation protein RsbU (phosphoserine phosphatase)
VPITRAKVPDWARDRGVIGGLATAGALVLVDVVARVQLTGGYAIGAIVTSIFSSARRTAAIGLVALATMLASFLWNDYPRLAEWTIRFCVGVLLSALATYSALLRERREASFRRLTVIAETAQRAVLRASPTAIGSAGFATRYVSASKEASVGGDLYEIVATPFGVRVIVGDVRGKGLPAVQTAASVLGAFRQAAFTEPDPVALAAAIDDVVSRLIDEEEFITAIFAEFKDDTVTLANCGHHPPLLLDHGRARVLDTGEPTTPLGLHPQPVLSRHPWSREDRLLLYTDGLVEARNRRGVFFPLDQEAGSLARAPLAEALDRVVDRLRDFAGGRIADDVALVLAEHRGA